MIKITEERKRIKGELVSRLKRVEDSRDFILGILTAVKTDDDRKKIIEFIDKGKDVNYENIMILSMKLEAEHDGKDLKFYFSNPITGEYKK